MIFIPFCLHSGQLIRQQSLLKIAANLKLQQPKQCKIMDCSVMLPRFNVLRQIAMACSLSAIIQIAIIVPAKKAQCA